jgi:hypothetical protein
LISSDHCRVLYSEAKDCRRNNSTVDAQVVVPKHRRRHGVAVPPVRLRRNLGVQVEQVLTELLGEFRLRWRLDASSSEHVAGWSR